MTALLVVSAERPSNAELGNALARAVARLACYEGGAGVRERWRAGEPPNLPKLAAQIGVPLNTLCEVFAEEVYYTTGHLIGARGRVQ